MTPQIMTSEQVAELIGCTKDEVDAFALAKELPATRIGERWIFTMDTLIAFIEQGIDENLEPVIETPKTGRRPENISYHAAKRRAVKRQRLAAWADHAKIEQMYADALRLSKETGIPHHVDHIIPMQGVRVSGLHVETNLQVIPAVENMKKHNRFEIGEHNE
jgi:excisionase family DNA binding protein